MNKIILVFFLFLSLPTYSLSKQLGCFKGLVLFGNYNDNLTIKIDDHKKSVEIDGLSFVSNTVSVYDELTKENLLTLQGDKTIGDKVYSFTFEESRNVISYSMIDTKDNKNNFILLYECKGWTHLHKEMRISEFADCLKYLNLIVRTSW